VPTPSKYQQDILTWLDLEDGNALISACAGSGKTSTLVMLADLIPTGARAIFVAFNKAIARELKTRLPNTVEASTFHGVCFRALARTIPESVRKDWVQGDNNAKMHSILDDMTVENRKVNEVRTGIIRLVGLMKGEMLLPDCPVQHIVSLIERHEIDFQIDDPEWITPQDIISFAREALTLSNNMTQHIDYDDMLYMTAIRNIPIQRYGYVFIDEAQDFNTVQRYLLAKMLGQSGRLIAVGDERQAIYGFRGAGTDSMRLIEQQFTCKRLPLSISYRCSAAIVRLAQTIAPEIQAREGAPEGTVSTLDTFKLDDFRAEDMVVCRNTAPLVTLAFRFVRAHKPVRMMGRDIGEGLIAVIKKMRAHTLEELDDAIRAWSDREISKALSKRLEAKAQRIQDQCDTIVAMCEGMPENERTVAHLTTRIRDLFTDVANTPRTTLATVHKSKGMEAHRVFVLDPYLMPSKYAKLDWQQVQEENLRYVAYTRALDTLHFVNLQDIA
jgi:DNA helicase-2/ATP-dependent DNA helicase PcrA